MDDRFFAGANLDDGFLAFTDVVLEQQYHDSMMAVPRRAGECSAAAKALRLQVDIRPMLQQQGYASCPGCLLFRRCHQCRASLVILDVDRRATLEQLL